MEALDETGKPPEERLKEQGLWDAWDRLRENDDKRSGNRARVQGAVDGNAPWDPAVLAKHGQADRTNVNFLELSSVIQDWEDAYMDLALGVQKYFALTPAIELGDDVLNVKCAIEDCLQVALEEWPGWLSGHLAQINQLVTHGHGHFYFPVVGSWQFMPLKVGEVKIPDDFRGDLDNLPLCALGPFPMTLIDLFAMVRTPEAKAYAKSKHWDVDVIEATILECANRDVEEKDRINWEQCQQQLQRGNIGVVGDSTLNQGCQVVHMYVKEYDGTITKYIFAEKTDSGLPLLKHTDAVDKITDAVAFFFFRGSKTNYHEVRGVGRDGYNAAVVANRLQCRVVDEGENAMIPTYKAGPGGDGRDQVRTKGMYRIIPSGWEGVAEKQHGTFQAGSAAARSVRSILASSTKSPTLTQSVMRDSTQPRTAAEIEASNNMGQDVRITLQTLYYKYRDFFLQNVYRRFFGEKMSDQEPGAEIQQTVWGKLVAKGIDQSMWAPSNWLVRAARAIGNGSAASRRQALEAIGSIYPRMDTVGQKNWDREWTALHAGYNLADQFVARANRDELPSADRSYAQLETAAILAGVFQVQASPDQPPRIHCMVHMEAAAGIQQQFQQTGDPRQVQALDALLGHVAQHVDFMLQDQNMIEEAQQWHERLAGFVDTMKEMGRQFQAMQAEQQKQQQSEMQKQVEIEAARRSGAAEAELAGKLEKVHSDERVKMVKQAGAHALKAEKQQSDFELALKRLDSEIIIAKQKATHAKSQPK